MSTIRSFLAAATLGTALAITVATLAVLSSPTRAADRPVYLTLISEESEALLDDPFIADHLRLIPSTLDNVTQRIDRYKAEGLILDRSTIASIGADQLYAVRAQGLLLVALDMNHTELHNATLGDWPEQRVPRAADDDRPVQYATSWRILETDSRVQGGDGSTAFQPQIFVSQLALLALMIRGDLSFEPDRPTYLQAISPANVGIVLHPEVARRLEFVQVNSSIPISRMLDETPAGLLVDRATVLIFSGIQYGLLYSQGLVIVGIDLTAEELRTAMEGDRSEEFRASLAAPRDPSQPLEYSYMWRDREHLHPVTAGPTEATERLHLPRLAQLLYEVAPRATDRTPRTNSPTP